MKKSILLIELLVFTVNSYSQFIYDFDRTPLTHDIDDAIEKVNSKILTPDEFKTFITWNLAFIVNDTVYAISYEDTTYVKYTTIKNEIGYSMYKTFANTRNVFLYRRDSSGWVKASDTIQTDYYKSVSLGLNPKTNLYDDAYLYRVFVNHTKEYVDDAYGCVRKLKDGRILMLIPTAFGDSRINNDNVPYTYNKIVIFIPKCDGNYNVSKFEPITKDTRQPELYANHRLDITEHDNSVKIEIWIKAKLVGDEKPDGFVTIQSERREVKIPYKIKLFCTLNFEILKGKVYYSGNYMLTQTR